MATRTVKLRLHVPQDDNTARALWSTDQIVTQAADIESPDPLVPTAGA